MTVDRDDTAMPPLRPVGRVCVLFAVALSVSSAVLLAPGTTQASCGSYVTVHSPGTIAPEPVPQSGFGNRVTQPPLSQTGFGQVPPSDHSGKPRPCSGPSCSNQPSIPPPPVVTSVRALGDEASGIAVFTLAVEASSAPVTEGLSRQPPLQHPLAIFHPPRSPRHF
jgi:hypothetical protein